MMRAIRNGALIGAAVGIGVAIVLITLTFVRPFPWQVNGAVEKLTFRLCPLFILGFGTHSLTSLIILTILGNVILYGTAGGVIAAIFSLCKRHFA